jgi:hypothetical protein
MTTCRVYPGLAHPRAAFAAAPPAWCRTNWQVPGTTPVDRACRSLHIRFPLPPARLGKLRLGFIGVWDTKGGDMVLSASERFRAHRDDIESTIWEASRESRTKPRLSLASRSCPSSSRETLWARSSPSFSSSFSQVASTA